MCFKSLRKTESRGNIMNIEVNEELRKSLGLTCTKPLYECKVGNVIVDNIGNEWYVLEQDIENNNQSMEKQ